MPYWQESVRFLNNRFVNVLIISEEPMRRMHRQLNKKSAIELKFAKSDEQKAKNCTVRREEKGIR